MTTIKEAIDEIKCGITELRSELEASWKQIWQVVQDMNHSPTEANRMDEDSSNPEDSQLVSHSVQHTLKFPDESILFPMVEAVESDEIVIGFQLYISESLLWKPMHGVNLDLVLESSSCYLHDDLNLCTPYVRRNANEGILYLSSTRRPPPLPPEFTQHVVRCFETQLEVQTDFDPQLSVEGHYDEYVVNALIQVYGACVHFEFDCNSFDESPVRDSVIWIVLLKAGVSFGSHREAFRLSEEMTKLSRFRPDEEDEKQNEVSLTWTEAAKRLVCDVGARFHDRMLGPSKAGLSKSSTPVWLLGISYDIGEGSDSTVLADFERDFSSRILVTYRKGFSAIGDSKYTSERKN